jgi:hypothetical protein
LPISTMLLMLRIPSLRRISWSQRGEGPTVTALDLTDRKLRALARGGSHFKIARGQSHFLRFREFHFPVEETADLAGDIHDRVHIGTVRKDRKIEDGVAKSKILKDLFVTDLKASAGSSSTPAICFSLKDFLSTPSS